jgi:ribonuclease PH
MRADGRSNVELRPIKMELGYLKHHEGSVLISGGDTKVLVTVTSETRVPPHRYEIGGWLSAEYDMLPGATETRKPRAINKLRQDGRTVEISRLIGRSLRQAVNLDVIGQRTLLIDCDVIQADAGTRCLSITGAYVALCAHVAMLIKTGQLKMLTMEDVITRPVAAVSLGVVNGQVLTDLTYLEDVKADADCNVVGTTGGHIVDFQCTAEQKPISKDHIDQIYTQGEAALASIIEQQNKALMRLGIMFHR